MNLKKNILADAVIDEQEEKQKYEVLFTELNLLKKDGT
jgi:hypothetical protein